MKIRQITKVVGIIALVGFGGAMTITNPGQKAYEQYAMKRLTSYLKENVCTQTPEGLGKLLENQCSTLVDLGRPQIQNLIASRTQRQNFLLFSIYSTELSVPAPLPSYRFEAVGAFQKFYIYEAEEL